MANGVEKSRILVISGPNLNLLGRREPHIYGVMGLEQIHENLKRDAERAGVEIEFFQSNSEGAIIDKIHESIGRVHGIIINPGAYTHYSIAILDALRATQLPIVEVHLSNLARREDYRQKSVISEVAVGVISGFGPYSYHLGFLAMVQILRELAAQHRIQRQTFGAKGEQ
ncbi:MAG: type II 3-dehydroquinate dehydratase [Campylobacterales bacterium]